MQHRKFLPKLGLVAGLLLTQPVFAESGAAWDTLITKHAQASFKQYLELLALPNDAIVAEDIQKNVQWLETAFRQRGFVTKQLPNQGKPMLYAEHPLNNPAYKTVLFYMHLDGQPVIPAQWSQKSPWGPVLKQKNTKGEWDAVSLDKLFDATLDPELRVFARAAADDKGPIMMFLAAIDTMKTAGIAPKVNIKVLLDSEEEKGSPSISSVVGAHMELLRAEALVIHDGPMHASNKPTLVFGNRGFTAATLTVFGSKLNLHSGHYGNYAPNPAQRLANLLASMKNDEGLVTIPGYYDNIKLSEAERKILTEVGDDEGAIQKRLGIANAERVGKNYQEAMQYPSLNIRGMGAGAIGDKVATIVPDKAIAELDLRTTPEANADYLFKLVESHIKHQGYHLVKDKPTDQERATYDKIAAFSLGGATNAARMNMDSPIGTWAYGSLKNTFSDNVAAGSPIRIRMMGGTVPTASIVDALNLPFVIVPLVNPDNNQHSFDENLRIGNYLTGMKTIIGLMKTPF